MKTRVTMFTLLMAFMLTLAVAVPAMAAEGTFTVKQTVVLPNAVLAPGTYVFRQIGSDPIIQISEVGGRGVGIYMTMPVLHRGGVTALRLKDQHVQSIHFAGSESEMQFLYPANTEAAQSKVFAETTGF